ncbi:MAG TPA: hypothetical protein VGP94_09070 [Tepidisphaeraceae bacterium]|jgi:hypothetical protein|nr:hypothetical protein [Tepidisphaeraceae bacterium]
MPSIDYFNPKLPHHLHRTADEISAEEQARLRAQFAPILSSYRAHHRGAVLTFVLGFILMLISARFPVAMCGVIPIYAVALLIALGAPRLCCPNCGKRIDKGLGQFCPECSRCALAPGDFFSAPECSACGKKIRNDKYHSYTTHACTHCGLWLDDEGI